MVLPSNVERTLDPDNPRLKVLALPLTVQHFSSTNWDYSRMKLARLLKKGR